jgi:hypothetical protein
MGQALRLNNYRVGGGCLSPSMRAASVSYRGGLISLDIRLAIIATAINDNTIA